MVSHYFINATTDNKLKLMIEDSINRFNFEFDNPTKDASNDGILFGRGVKGMLAKGPELRMEIIPTQLQEAACAVRIIVFKGNKNLFKDDILLNDIDANRLRIYLENFIHNNDKTAIH